MTQATTETILLALLVLLTLAMMTDAASAQQRAYYDAGGRVLGRSATDSSGTVANYDSRGRVISRETMTANTTTVYDASGRNAGRFTANR
jgi:YD repeat-containing protein